MKLSTIFVGALATLTTAAPTKVEEEKRNSGFDAGSFGSGGFDSSSFDSGSFGDASGFDVGGGFDAFGLGGAAAFGSNLALFGGNVLQGNVFNSGLVNSFNSFNVANANVAFLLGANNFDINALFSFFDLSLAVDPFSNIFNFGAGNFIDVQTLLQVNNALVFQWLLNQFGNQLFFQEAFLGFQGLQLPTLNFDILGGAGLGLQTQFLIQQDLLDANIFNQFSSGCKSFFSPT